MKNLINAEGTINVHEEFTFPKSTKSLKIIGSEDLYKSGIWNVIETVKNLDTNKLTEIKREDLQKLKPYIIC
jgi:hypothetical protein|tara:strand:+ start:2733 stop:2948 length:216 start_codon:yes stop_codon:yes gene_type:complete